MLRVAMIGCGAIGQGVLEALRDEASIRIETVVVGAQGRAAAQAALARLAPEARLVERLADAARPDLVVECAGHAAIVEHVIPALEGGLPCIVASIGALSEPGLVERLENAASTGKTRCELIAGAIGAIDALAAAKVGGLESVVYTGRKPPLAWRGTPAEKVCDLASLKVAERIFAGSAREAALAYPKNANVAATVSLAGLGLDATQVELWADPAVDENVHRVEASGAFGRFELTMRGKPLAANPKTSALTVYSAVRALLNRARPLAI